MEQADGRTFQIGLHRQIQKYLGKLNQIWINQINFLLRQIQEKSTEK